MIVWDMLFPFILACFVIEATPGPNMTYLAVLSVKEGRRAGFFAVLGVASGLLIVGIAAALGLAAAISKSFLLYQTLRWCGVFYLLWLAWDGWRTDSETSPGKADGGLFSDVKYFKRGLWNNLLNPKAAIFYIAILPRFVDSSSRVVSQVILLTLIYVSIATVIHSFIVALGGTARTFLEGSPYTLLVRRALSLILVIMALWLAMTTSQELL